MDILMRTMNTNQARRTGARIRNNRRRPQYGKVFYIISALLFIADSVINGQPLFFTGKVLLLLGCYVLLADYTLQKGENAHGHE
jgi:hypothetical protein